VSPVLKLVLLLVINWVSLSLLGGFIWMLIVKRSDRAQELADDDAHAHTQTGVTLHGFSSLH
jgi:hypothetical protein